MTFWDRIQTLCKEKSTTPTALCKSLGLSTSMVTRWKNGTIPNSSTLKIIADHLEVEPQILMWGESNGNDPKEKTPDIKPNAIMLDEKKIHLIPIFETVSAGFGALASNDVTDYMPLYINAESEAAETICIRVRGDSMYPKIEDGDIIQVHKQDTVDSGSIAVILLDGEEGLVKRIEYHLQENRVELHSINPMYKVMTFEGADILRLRVLGLVKKIIKDV